jgi:hypothetical protein
MQGKHMPSAALFLDFSSFIICSTPSTLYIVQFYHPGRRHIAAQKDPKNKSVRISVRTYLKRECDEFFYFGIFQ